MKKALVTAAMAAIALATIAPAHASTGMVLLPCTTPVPTSRGVPILGMACGAKITPITLGRPFTVHPSQPADLDIYFLDDNQNLYGEKTGGAGYCGDLNGTVPPKTEDGSATYAVVVLTLSSCGLLGEAAVSFTYTEH